MNPRDGTIRASELMQCVTQAAQGLAGFLALVWTRETVGHENQPVERWISFFQFRPTQNVQRFNNEAFPAGFVQTK